MKIGDNVRGSDASVMYDCDGVIIGETKKFWIVVFHSHYTFDKLWENNENKKVYFHKNNNLQKGFSKEVNTTGNFLKLSKLKKSPTISDKQNVAIKHKEVGR